MDLYDTTFAHMFAAWDQYNIALAAQHGKHKTANLGSTWSRWYRDLDRDLDLAVIWIVI